MGLDMYISSKEGSDIAYWRKEPAIHERNIISIMEDDEEVIYDSWW